MNSSQRALGRATRVRCSTQSPIVATQRRWARHASNSPQHGPRRRGGKLFGFAAVFMAAAAGSYYYPKLTAQAKPEVEAKQPAKVELAFETPREHPASKEDNRDLISSQHLQVKNSWDHPGVYAWGSNVGKVIDPNSNEKYVKLPRRIGFFNDQLLRDLKLTQDFGAAITETGDLVQWGLGFSKANPKPETTLKGRDLIKLEVSADRLIALSRKGVVYSIPSSRDDQEGGVKQDQQKSSWSLWSSGGGKETISFRTLTPSNLGLGEKVTDISSGLEHCLLLTSKGRVFAAASSSTSFPSKGQMGIPGLGWETRPQGAYDQAHEIMTLNGFHVAKIATGDRHSVVLDKIGRLFSFGDNTFGQLGFETEGGMPYISAPAMVPINNLYASSGLVSKVTMIAAGGTNTFFGVDANAPSAGEAIVTAPAKRMPRTVSDFWACGQGMSGTLGTGRWTHVSLAPTKVKALSSLFEFDEKTNKMMPIKLKALSIGATHCSAVMDNVTETNISSRSTENETNWGADVMFWGGNEYYQLGTGKRTNMNAPTYIGPLDGGEGDADKGRKGEMHRLCLTPRQTARIGGAKGRKVSLEQKVECGRFVTGVYSSV